MQNKRTNCQMLMLKNSSPRALSEGGTDNRSAEPGSLESCWKPQEKTALKDVAAYPFN